MQEYETLKRLVAEGEDDVNKSAGGNKAAGTRVRKKMQEIIAAAKSVRQKILEIRETPESGSPGSGATPGSSGSTGGSTSGSPPQH